MREGKRQAHWLGVIGDAEARERLHVRVVQAPDEARVGEPQRAVRAVVLRVPPDLVARGELGRGVGDRFGLAGGRVGGQ